MQSLLTMSWQRLWQGLGAEGDGSRLRDALLTAWAEPQRHYHTLQHLTECLLLLEEMRVHAQESAEIEAALWFHDAVYAPQRQDNEAQSAAWAQRVLAPAGVAATRVSRIARMVLATRHGQAHAITADEELLLDIDLAILGADHSRFAEYETQIRREYDFVPQADFRSRRRVILAEFAQRPVLFHHRAMQERFGPAAQRNLRHALGDAASHA